MDYYVKKTADTMEYGTEKHPFTTIEKAVSAAEPGDTIWIGKGIYREWVKPSKGGTDNEHRITYKNIPDEKPVITGSEELLNWIPQGNNVWKTSISDEILKEYNPYKDKIFGDWYDDFGQVHHTGEIFMDDKALYEAPDFDHLKQEGKPERNFSWLGLPHETETEIWVHLPGINPNEHKMEASIRPFCFFPEVEGVNFITVSGLVIEKAATQWAPPTAFQPGAIGTHWSKGWIIENCEIKNSKCAGISIGKRHDDKDNIWSIDPSKGGAQTYTEIIFSNLRRDWSKEKTGSHIIRRNIISDCGQAGIVGCMGGVFSVISDNHIYNINTRKEFGGAEMGGIKLHCAIDVSIINNIIHDCIRGIWLDWEAQGARVSRNALWNNAEEDLFIEVCHGPCTVDNNIMLSTYNLLNVSQGTAYVHNLFAGKIRLFRDPNRFTMYHFPHDTFVQGSMIIYGGDDKIYNNIYIGSNHEEAFGNAIYDGYSNMTDKPDTSGDDQPMSYADTTLPVSINNNLYFNSAAQWEHESDTVKEENFHAEFQIKFSDGKYYLETNLSEYSYPAKLNLVTSAMLGISFESGGAYENTDGTPFVVDRDFSGKVRNGSTVPGPFAEFPSRILLEP